MWPFNYSNTSATYSKYSNTNTSQCQTYSLFRTLTNTCTQLAVAVEYSYNGTHAAKDKYHLILPVLNDHYYCGPLSCGF